MYQFDANGLIPTIVQDINSGSVLMLGYQNQEAIDQSAAKGLVTFYSRSKKRLWTKGETSGNQLKIIDIKVDCDQDALLYLVEPPDNTCHTGSFSCFGEAQSFGILMGLERLIANRKKELPKGSYTTELFTQGLDQITQKVGEEAIEVVIAAKNESREDFLNESCDLLYHWMVLCREKGVELKEVLEVLESRRNQ